MTEPSADAATAVLLAPEISKAGCNPNSADHQNAPDCAANPPVSRLDPTATAPEAETP